MIGQSFCCHQKSLGVEGDSLSLRLTMKPCEISINMGKQPCCSGNHASKGGCENHPPWTRLPLEELIIAQLANEVAVFQAT
jgi:hypothetical protein